MDNDADGLRTETDPSTSEVSTDQRASSFPPLGNAGLATFAIAEVGSDPALELLRDALVDPRPPAALAYPHEADRWLGAAVRRANDQRYRFELRHLHDGIGPRVLDISDPSAAALLRRPAVLDGRATAKLVVAVALDGPGCVDLTASGIDADATLRRGTLIMWPAFLSIQTVPDGGPLHTLVTTVHGPAFR